MIEAATADHDAVAAAIESSGLTVAEVADRAGLEPAQLHRFPLDRVPLAVLSRLADVVGVPLRQLLSRGRDGYPEDWGDRSVVGAYLAEFKDGLSRDQLSDALGWTLQRVEHALGALDAALEEVGMRLARNADRSWSSAASSGWSPLPASASSASPRRTSTRSWPPSSGTR